MERVEEVWVSLTVAEECVLVVQSSCAVLTGGGWRLADKDEDMTVCTLLFSVFTLSLLLSSSVLLLKNMLM